MTIVTGKIHHEDGSTTIALADNERSENGGYKTVVSFPEPGGTYEIDHEVPSGTGPGQFSS